MSGQLLGAITGFMLLVFIPTHSFCTYAFHATGVWDSPHRVFDLCFFQLTSARTSLSRFPAAVSLLLTVPNDDSGILTVIPLALFGSEAERFTSSLLLSFAGGDTASLVDRVLVMPLELLCSMASQPPRVGAVA